MGSRRGSTAGSGSLASTGTTSLGDLCHTLPGWHVAAPASRLTVHSCSPAQPPASGSPRGPSSLSPFPCLCYTFVFHALDQEAQSKSMSRAGCRPGRGNSPRPAAQGTRFLRLQGWLCPSRLCDLRQDPSLSESLLLSRDGDEAPGLPALHPLQKWWTRGPCRIRPASEGPVRGLGDLSDHTGGWETAGPTHCGLSHWRVLNFTPVPQVREQEPNGLQAPQLPSRLRMSGVSQMQCPLKQC